MADPNDYTTGDEREVREVEPVDWSGLHDLAELEGESALPEESEPYSSPELAELRAIRELLGVQVTQFGTVVQIIGELAGKADSLFGGDGPQLSGPMGAMLSALIPRKR